MRGIVKKNVSTSKEHTKELKSLRGEVSALRGLLNTHPASQPSDRSVAFPNRELNILTDNIAKIGNKESQVETLHMQFEILKGRSERMEE